MPEIPPVRWKAIESTLSGPFPEFHAEMPHGVSMSKTRTHPQKRWRIVAMLKTADSAIQFRVMIEDVTEAAVDAAVRAADRAVRMADLLLSLESEDA